MATYAELQAQKAAIEKELARSKAKAFNVTLTTFANICKDSGFSLEEMASALTTLHNRRQRAGTKAPAKFRNTVTGKTWSGRGKKPEWVGGENRVAV